jgi:uncharacterized protein YndB with AHSA1/START domain
VTDSDGATITRIINAPPQAVFDAWVDPVQFARWFGGGGVFVPAESVTLDARPGGSWTATMVIGNGIPDIHWVGEYVEVDPPSKLVLTLSDVAEARELVTVNFTEVDRDGRSSTEMLFRQTGGNLSPDEYARAQQGWEGFFDALAEVVSAR